MVELGKIEILWSKTSTVHSMPKGESPVVAEEARSIDTFLLQAKRMARDSTV